MNRIKEASLFATWIVFLTMLVPRFNFMNASFGFWVWIAVGFSIYHYLEKKPETNFGVKIGFWTGIYSLVSVICLILFVNLLFNNQGYLPIVNNLNSFLLMALQAFLFLFIPAVLMGYIIELIYLNKNKIKSNKKYLIPLLFSITSYCTASAIMVGFYYPLVSDIIFLFLLSVFAFHSIKYFNIISKKKIKTVFEIVKYSLIFNLFTIISIMILNRVFDLFNVPKPIFGELAISNISIINEIAGHVYLSIIAGFWMILLGTIAYYYHIKNKRRYKK